MTTRYFAIHASYDMDLHGWDDRRVADHKQKDFLTGKFVHIIDRQTSRCVACDAPEYLLRALKNPACSGPGQVSIVGGVVGGTSPQDTLRDMIEKYKITPSPDDCHTEPEKPKDEKVVAESAKPTTGVDWKAHKDFLRGL